MECSDHNRSVAQIWDERPPAVHHYALVIGLGLEQVSVNKYDATYTSFPPIAFLIHYFASKIFGMTREFYDRWMQIWPLCLNFLCGVLLYQLVRRIIGEKENLQPERAQAVSLNMYRGILFQSQPPAFYQQWILGSSAL